MSLSREELKDALTTLMWSRRYTVEQAACELSTAVEVSVADLVALHKPCFLGAPVDLFPGRPPRS